LIFIVFMFAETANAGGAMNISDGRELIGIVTKYNVQGSETLHKVALEHYIGFNEIVDANPHIDPWVPKWGQKAVLPTMWVLPDAPRKAIVINLAEMRLYYYWSLNGRAVVSTYPIGVGVSGFETRLGKYKVLKKIMNPSWVVPAEIRSSEPGLPAVVPPGPDNPLGDRAMVISSNGYLIHGTNAPYGIGRRVSHGCIRLYPDDINELFSITPRGTEVTIVYQPVKVAVRGDDIYIEVHDDYMERGTDVFSEAALILAGRGLTDKVVKSLLDQAVDERLGYPVRISR